MHIEKVTVLTGKVGCDELILHTDLPSPVYPFEGNATCKLSVAKGDGESYALAHFGAEVEVIVLE